MKRSFVLFGALAVLLTVGFMIGCEENPSSPPVAPADDAVNSIQLRLTNNQHRLIQGYDGEHRVEEVTAVALNARGTGVLNVAVDFGIRGPATWKGYFQSVDRVTNADGEIKANYVVDLQQAGVVEIEARAGQVTQTLPITLQLVDTDIGELILETSRSVLTVPSGETRSATISATVIDEENHPIEGLQVRFRHEPANKGELNINLATTDLNGQVAVKFTTASTDPPRFGDVVIYATVGEIEESVTVAIRPYARAARIILRSDADNNVKQVAEGVEAIVQLTAVVTDTGGVGVEGATVEFRMAVSGETEALFGSITPLDTTDANGIIVVTFNSRGGYGSLRITAKVLPSGIEGQNSVEGAEEVKVRIGRGVEAKGGKTTAGTDDEDIVAWITLQIIQEESRIASLNLKSLQSYLLIDSDSLGETTVQAQVRDIDNNGIINIPIDFRTDLGVLANVTTTDLNGVARATFRNNFEFGTATITATIPGSVVPGSDPPRPFTAQTQIVVAQTIQEVTRIASLNLESSQSTLRVAPGSSGETTVMAQVLDIDNNGILNIGVIFSTNLGALSHATPTDSNGVARVTFRNNFQYGTATITAMIPGSVVPGSDPPLPFTDQTQIVVQIIQEEARITSLNLESLKSYMRISPDSLGETTVLAQVLDIDNNGILNITVNFSTDLGALSRATRTDTNGVARATFRNNFQFGTATVTATIPGSVVPGSNPPRPFTDQTQIVVERSAGETGTIRLSIDIDTIFADGGQTIATLTAVLKDEDQQSLAGRDIIFTTTEGTASSPERTDSLGIATSTFTDIGFACPIDPETGEYIPSKIMAKFNEMDLADSTYCTIKQRETVARIELNVGANILPAGSRDSIQVSAACFLGNERLAPDGITVLFEVDNMMGTFSEARKVLTGGTGTALTKFLAGPTVGLAVIRAKVINWDNTEEYSNAWTITLIPGPPYAMGISAFPTELITNNPDAYSTITVVVVDSTWNPVERGTQVRFVTTAGTVTPSAFTDSTGVAIARLTPGVVAGVAEITGSVPTAPNPLSRITTVRLISGFGNSIELSATPINIQVRGGGEGSTATLMARLYDANHNLVETPTPVVFELVAEPPEPLGCNINNRGQRDTVLTAHGEARASVNAGTQVGPIMLRAYTIDEAGNPTDVEAMNSNVAVVSGPPASIEIDINEEGADAGGGTWIIEVSARIFDEYHNPVADSIPVVFTASDTNGFDPNILTLTQGFTGNTGISGAQEAGLAYSAAAYNSNNTFDPATILAWCRTRLQGLDRVSGIRDIILPLQEGEMTLTVDPSNWMFVTDAPHDSLEVRVTAILKDGHDILINNAPILFGANRARFFYIYRIVGNDPRFKMFRPNPTIRHTGPENDGATPAEIPFDDDERGEAEVWLRGQLYDFFLDPFTLEVTVQLEARVVGYGDVAADPTFLFVTRRPPED